MADELTTTSNTLPELASTPALEIGAEDVAFPRVKIGQYMTKLVQDGEIPAGSIFTSLGEDDPDAQVLYENGDEQGVLFHVLSMTRGKSVSEGGELVVFDYNDPDAPADAWTTYNYVVVLPEADTELPFKWLLTRTSKGAAQQINMVLAKSSAAGPPYAKAFRATTAQRENKKGKFFVPRIQQVEPEEANVAVCENLSNMISPDAATAQASGEEPAI